MRISALHIQNNRVYHWDWILKKYQNTSKMLHTDINQFSQKDNIQSWKSFNFLPAKELVVKFCSTLSLVYLCVKCFL